MRQPSDEQMGFDLLTAGPAAGRGLRRRILLPDADVLFYPALFERQDADRYLHTLLNESNWVQEKIKWYGKLLDLPRLSAWYGDAGKSYVYSGIRMEPSPWTATLQEIRWAVERVSNIGFNSVLLNYYRTGRDSVAWHSDDEPELGIDPVIGSLSLGESRTFQLRSKRDKQLGTAIELGHGSYLLMRGPTQRHWVHQIPKTTRSLGPRINLTFRVIHNVTPERPKR